MFSGSGGKDDASTHFACLSEVKNSSFAIFCLFAATLPIDLLIEISGLAGVTDGQHKRLLRLWIPPILRDVGRRSTANDDLAHAIFHAATDQRMSCENVDPVSRGFNHRECTPGIPDRDELEDPLEIRKRPRCQPYGRHALARGLFTFSPRAFAAR